jgi:hypothetical protein
MERLMRTLTRIASANDISWQMLTHVYITSLVVAYTLHGSSFDNTLVPPDLLSSRCFQKSYQDMLWYSDFRLSVMQYMDNMSCHRHLEVMLSLFRDELWVYYD